MFLLSSYHNEQGDLYSISWQEVTDADMKSQEKDEQQVIIQADELEVLVFLLPIVKKLDFEFKLVIDRLQEQGRNSHTAYFSDDRCHRTSKPSTWSC